jgi:hypothetical protein
MECFLESTIAETEMISAARSCRGCILLILIASGNRTISIRPGRQEPNVVDTLGKAPLTNIHKDGRTWWYMCKAVAKPDITSEEVRSAKGWAECHLFFPIGRQNTLGRTRSLSLVLLDVRTTMKRRRSWSWTVSYHNPSIMSGELENEFGSHSSSSSSSYSFAEALGHRVIYSWENRNNRHETKRRMFRDKSKNRRSRTKVAIILL